MGSTESNIQSWIDAHQLWQELKAEERTPQNLTDEADTVSLISSPSEKQDQKQQYLFYRNLYYLLDETAISQARSDNDAVSQIRKDEQKFIFSLNDSDLRSFLDGFFSKIENGEIIINNFDLRRKIISLEQVYHKNTNLFVRQHACQRLAQMCLDLVLEDCRLSIESEYKEKIKSLLPGELNTITDLNEYESVCKNAIETMPNVDDTFKQKEKIRLLKNYYLRKKNEDQINIQKKVLEEITSQNHQSQNPSSVDIFNRLDSVSTSDSESDEMKIIGSADSSPSETPHGEKATPLLPSDTPTSVLISTASDEAIKEVFPRFMAALITSGNAKAVLAILGMPECRPSFISESGWVKVKNEVSKLFDDIEKASGNNEKIEKIRSKISKKFERFFIYDNPEVALIRMRNVLLESSQLNNLKSNIKNQLETTLTQLNTDEQNKKQGYRDKLIKNETKLFGRLLEKCQHYGKNALIKSEALANIEIQKAIVEGNLRLSDVVNRREKFAENRHWYRGIWRYFRRATEPGIEGKEWSEIKALRRLHKKENFFEKTRHVSLSLFFIATKTLSSIGNCDVFIKGIIQNFNFGSWANFSLRPYLDAGNGIACLSSRCPSVWKDFATPVAQEQTVEKTKKTSADKLIYIAAQLLSILGTISYGFAQFMGAYSLACLLVAGIPTALLLLAHIPFLAAFATAMAAFMTSPVGLIIGAVLVGMITAILVAAAVVTFKSFYTNGIKKNIKEFPKLFGIKSEDSLKQQIRKIFRISSLIKATTFFFVFLATTALTGYLSATGMNKIFCLVTGQKDSFLSAFIIGGSLSLFYSGVNAFSQIYKVIAFFKSPEKKEITTQAPNGELPSAQPYAYDDKQRGFVGRIEQHYLTWKSANIVTKFLLPTVMVADLLAYSIFGSLNTVYSLFGGAKGLGYVFLWISAAIVLSAINSSMSLAFTWGDAIFKNVNKLQNSKTNIQLSAMSHRINPLLAVKTTKPYKNISGKCKGIAHAVKTSVTVFPHNRVNGIA